MIDYLNKMFFGDDLQYHVLKLELLKSSCKGLDDLVVKTLDKGANINGQNCDGNSALILALNSGHHSTVKLLLDKGVNPYLKNENGEDALYCTKYNNDFEMILLLKEGIKNYSNCVVN